jgi:tetratricopeptide (TPR) repeat protein
MGAKRKVNQVVKTVLFTWLFFLLIFLIGGYAAQVTSPTSAVSKGSPVGTISVDYPADGSVFPPEFPPPTFLWRDLEEKATFWKIEISFGRSPASLHVKSYGERMRIGEIDPRCIAPTNELPKLTPEQAAAHTWVPDPKTWSLIKKNSVKQQACITITGFPGEKSKQSISRGSVTLLTSQDPVGAPVFYRDVPLMPNESEKGVIKPLPANAMGLIQWRLRNIADTQSRLLMGDLPTCANCHSFSLDGKTMGMDVDGPQNDKGLYTLIPVHQETSIKKEDIISWSSFRGKLGGRLRAAFMSQVSPDGRFIVTTIDDPESKFRKEGHTLEDKYYGANFKDYRFLQVFYPTRGILAWYSREAGMLQPLTGANDPAYVQTDGVWSPDGKYIVFARAAARPPHPEGAKRAEYANDPKETQIQYDLYRVPFNEGQGGTPEVIAGASQNGKSNNFPKVSPDGRWIVFVQCRNGQLMRPDSELYIVPFAGGAARRMRCNTSLMNSWHSFSPNGRWLVFSSKSRSPYTQMYLTHLDNQGYDSPAILIDNATASNRAVNIPEFLNIPQDGLLKMEAPVTDFFRLFDAAMELTQKKQYQAAVLKWRKAIELNPDDSRARFNLAVSLEQDGQREEAIAQYQKVLSIEPDSALAQVGLGTALAATGHLPDAIAHYTKALEIDPDNARAHALLGTTLLERGRSEEALSHFQRTLDLDAENADAQNGLGIILARRGRLFEALPHLEKAVEVKPDFYEFRFNLGRVLAAQGKFNEAIPHFEKAVNLSGGGDPQVLDMLAGLYSESGRFSEAVGTARKALVLALQQNNRTLVEALNVRIAYYEDLARSRRQP